MVKWTESMGQVFEYYTVDPNTWKDVKLLNTVKSCTINNDDEVETLGSASIDIDEMVGECYIRVYLVTIQNGVREKHPLGTFLVQTPSSSFDGKVRSVSMDAYTPLIELKESDDIPLGYALLKGDNIMDEAYAIVREHCRAPVVKISSGNDTQTTLPNEYQRIDYIESTGTQYIDTGVAVTQDTKIETVISILRCTIPNNPGYEDVQIQDQDYNLFGSYGSRMGLALGIYTGKLRWWNAAPQTQVFNYIEGQKYKIIMNDGGIYSVDGVAQTLTNTNVSSLSNSIYIFGAQHTGTPGTPLKPGALRVYTFKIFAGGKLLRNFIPCYRKNDNVAGLYDVVNNVFYTNLGTGDFIKGPTPIVPKSDKTLTSNFVSNTEDKWLSFTTDLLGMANYRFGLDELGRIIFKPIQKAEQLQPVYTFDDNNSSILYPELTLKHDIYGIPNVVEIICSTGTELHYSRVVNDDPNSPTSTIRRGREIVYRVTDPNLPAYPTKDQIDEYAENTLKSLSSVEYTVTYTHGYCPVRIGDCVRLNYKKAGLVDVKAKVISQSIKCEPGCPVSETAVFTTNLWK